MLCKTSRREKEPGKKLMQKDCGKRKRLETSSVDLHTAELMFEEEGEEKDFSSIMFE
jgi:hypothetical protein